MTRQAILEFAWAVSPRYMVAGKREKGVILDEFCKTTGYHCKSAVRLLRNPPPASRKAVEWLRKYGLPVVEALRQIWETSDRMCGKRYSVIVGGDIFTDQLTLTLSLTIHNSERVVLWCLRSYGIMIDAIWLLSECRKG